MKGSVQDTVLDPHLHSPCLTSASGRAARSPPQRRSTPRSCSCFSGSSSSCGTPISCSRGVVAGCMSSDAKKWCSHHQSTASIISITLPKLCAPPPPGGTGKDNNVLLQPAHMRSIYVQWQTQLIFPVASSVDPDNQTSVSGKALYVKNWRNRQTFHKAGGGVPNPQRCRCSCVQALVQLHATAKYVPQRLPVVLAQTMDLDKVLWPAEPLMESLLGG